MIIQKRSARGLEKINKTKNWLGKKLISHTLPPTLNSELRKHLQKKEKEMRPGGRE